MVKYCEGWTNSAVDCYNRGCNCRGCIIREVIGNECKMKMVVLSLVRQFGKPTKYAGSILPCMTKAMKSTVDVILSGVTTKKEIAEKLNIAIPTAQQRIDALCKAVQTQGYTFNNRIGRLPELIEILKDNIPSIPI